jgi:transcriptional regulator with XRE-family HTH domain
MQRYERAALRRARERRRLTQLELANALGMTRIYIVDIETGRKNPSFETMAKWVQALGAHGGMDLFDQWRPLDPITYEKRRAWGEAIRRGHVERALRRERERQGRG